MSTQKWRQLADKIGIIGYMTWSRDSKYVGFDTSFTVDPAFFRMSPSDGQVASRDYVAEHMRRTWEAMQQNDGGRNL